ncbi:MAG: hypothetical protein AAF602_05875, partial [Myxococcota bacterium]
DQPLRDTPDLAIYGIGGRFYPNNKGRGLFVGGGLHWWTANNVVLPEADDPDVFGFEPEKSSGATITRTGFNAKFGIRSQAKSTYSLVEFGLATYGSINTNHFDKPSENIALPLLLPSVAFSVGFATL